MNDNRFSQTDQLTIILADAMAAHADSQNPAVVAPRITVARCVEELDSRYAAFCEKWDLDQSLPVDDQLAMAEGHPAITTYINRYISARQKAVSEGAMVYADMTRKHTPPLKQETSFTELFADDADLELGDA